MTVRTLKSCGFITVKYPPSLRQHVDEAMSSWKDFCQLPIELKNNFSNDDRVNDFGYMRRKDKSHAADNKELFHLNRATLLELQNRAQAIPDRRATDFIDSVDSLITEIRPVINGLVQAIETEYSLPGFVGDVLENAENWTIRFLHYFGGEILAHPHADRGGLTLHLAESEEGGEYLDFKGIWRKWPVGGNQTIIFPGLKLQHRSESKLKALFHRVSPTEHTQKQGRFAMVAFLDFKSPTRFNDTKFRPQNFPAGFNYRMPNEKFNKLFVSS